MIFRGDFMSIKRLQLRYKVLARAYEEGSGLTEEMLEKYKKVYRKLSNKFLTIEDAFVLIEFFEKGFIDSLPKVFWSGENFNDNFATYLKVIYKLKNKINLKQYLEQDTIKFLSAHYLSPEEVSDKSGYIINTLNDIYDTRKPSLKPVKFERHDRNEMHKVYNAETLKCDYRKSLAQHWISEEFIIKHWSKNVLEMIMPEYRKWDFNEDEIFEILYGNKANN